MSKRGIKKVQKDVEVTITLDGKDVRELCALLDYAREKIREIKDDRWRDEERYERLQGTLDQYFQELEGI